MFHLVALRETHRTISSAHRPQVFEPGSDWQLLGKKQKGTGKTKARLFFESPTFQNSLYTTSIPKQATRADYISSLFLLLLQATTSSSSVFRPRSAKHKRASLGGLRLWAAKAQQPTPPPLPSPPILTKLPIQKSNIYMQFAYIYPHPTQTLQFSGLGARTAPSSPCPYPYPVLPSVSLSLPPPRLALPNVTA